MTKEQAIALAESKFWEPLSYEDRARFQMNEPLLCMPFDVLHEAVEKTLGRPVFTHEFAFEGLKAEVNGTGKAPTFAEILALLPAEKTVVLLTEAPRNED
jgi:hypothetical protein